MKIIKSAEEFRKFYPYKSPPNKAPCPALKDYPKRYPCVATIEHCEGGIGGCYMHVDIFYPPKNGDLKSFVAGLREREG